MIFTFYVLPMMLQLLYTVFAVYNKWFEEDEIGVREVAIIAFFIFCPIINIFAVFLSIEELFRYYEQNNRD